MTNLSRQTLSNSRLIVIKIGTSSLVDADGHLDQQKFKKISSEISSVIKNNKQVILVTSGAVAAGTQKLGIKSPLKTIVEKQAAAAIGQGLLMKEYEQHFAQHGIVISQVLLTRDAIEDRQRYINSRNTIDQILKFKAVPIINENDTVSIDEIKVGDNDNLSALVASLVGADLLIILSDVEGFIKDGEVVPVIDKISKDIEESASGSEFTFGTGGMLTKLQAAKIVAGAGIPMVIADNKTKDIIEKILNGEEVGTLFVPKMSKMESKKRWLMHGKKTSGKLLIDDGAENAILNKGKSLLPVGIKEVKGKFSQGDVVSIVIKGSKEIGRGITNYSSDELSRIKGKNSLEAEKILGVLPGDEVVHRDNMVVV